MNRDVASAIMSSMVLVVAGAALGFMLVIMGGDVALQPPRPIVSIESADVVRALRKTEERYALACDKAFVAVAKEMEHYQPKRYRCVIDPAGTSVHLEFGGKPVGKPVEVVPRATQNKMGDR